MGSAKELMYDIESERLEQRIADSIGIDIGTLHSLNYDSEWTESIFPELVVTILDGSDSDTLEFLDLSVGDTIRLEELTLESMDYYVDSDPWLSEVSDKYNVFLTHINSVEHLAEIPLVEETKFHLLVMLHAHVV